MAAYGWGKDRPVEDWLFAEGYRFDFFQAVRLLEMAHSSEVSVGEGAEPSKEAVRFKSSIGLDFPASDVVEVNAGHGGQPADMLVNFMGLAGVLGPLAMPSTEEILERAGQKDTAFRDFLDIFNHRLVSLLYRIRKLHRVGVDLKAPGQDKISEYLYSVIGLGTPRLHGRMQIRDRALLFYAGLIGQQPRSMVGLEFILADYFDVKVKGHQFHGQWFNLEKSQWTTIGAQGQNQRLGEDAVVVGTRVWEQQGRFEINLGPLGFDQFLDFLPIGWGFGPLCDLTRFYAGDENDFSFRLTLKAAEIPESRLGAENGPRLGWTSWLKTNQWQKDDSQVQIKPYFDSSKTKEIRLPLFYSLPPDKLLELVGRMTVRKYPKNTVVVRQGDAGDSMFAIRSGTVQVTRREDDGKQTLLSTLQDGDCFGEMALLTGKVRASTVVTTKDSEILELQLQDLEDFVQKYPHVERSLVAYYQSRVSKHNAQICWLPTLGNHQPSQPDDEQDDKPEAQG